MSHRLVSGHGRSDSLLSRIVPLLLADQRVFRKSAYRFAANLARQNALRRLRKSISETTSRAAGNQPASTGMSLAKWKSREGVMSQNVTDSAGLDLRCQTAVDQTRRWKTAALRTQSRPASRWCRWRSRRNGRGRPAALAARLDLCRPSDRNRRAGPANPHPAAGHARRRAGRLRRSSRTRRRAARRIRTPANHLNESC